MLVDYHSHTPRCNHATGSMSEYIERALKLGIAEFGISEHSPWMMHMPEVKYAMDWDEVPDYIAEVEKNRALYAPKGIKIRLGIEMDYVPDRWGGACEFVRKNSFDYTIGSIHHMGEWGFDQESQAHLFAEKDIREIYEDYFGLLTQMVRRGGVDIVGHLDLVKKFGHRPDESIADLLDTALNAVRETETVVEINTAGLDKPVKELYPAVEIIRMLHDRGIEITLGSDAHAPEQVGRYFTDTVRLLRDIGFVRIMKFEKRKKDYAPL